MKLAAVSEVILAGSDADVMHLGQKRFERNTRPEPSQRSADCRNAPPDRTRDAPSHWRGECRIDPDRETLPRLDFPKHT